MHIALIQMACGADPQANMTHAREKVADAATRGAHIVALPELFLSPYFCQRKDDDGAFKLAESIPGASSEMLGEIAKEHKIVLVSGSIFEKADNGKYYNTALVFGPDGKQLMKYRKTHIPEDPLYHEQHYFAPGDTGIDVMETPFGKISVLICYDQWYPEAARIAALKGAEIIFYPTAIGKIDASIDPTATDDWELMWRNAMLGHSAANNVFVAAINRVGKEDNITFWGGSFIADARSEVLAKAGDKEETVMAACDLAAVKELQDAWRFLHNRRPETYTPLTKNT